MKIVKWPDTLWVFCIFFCIPFAVNPNSPTFFLVQDWIIIVLDILRKQSCSKLMPNMAWAKAETL